MKKISLISYLFVFFFLFSGLVKAQEMYSAIEPLLNDAEKKEMEKAKTSIKKGDDLLKQVNDAEKKYDKYFNSDKEKKKKKGEKKSVDVKGLRIQAASNHEKGYQAIQKLYIDKLNTAEYAFAEDSKMATKLLTDAQTMADDGYAKLKNYKKLQSKELKDKEYAVIKRDLSDFNNKEQEAISNLVNALKIWLGQADKKEKNEIAEKQAWQDAQANNTISAYNGYISSYPAGKYVTEARNAIKKLEDKKREEELLKQKNNSNQGVSYRVQICADKIQCTDEVIKGKGYNLPDKYDEIFTDGFYKYWVGNFKKYDEAKAFKKKVGVRGAFVVCFNNGMQIDVKEAKKLEAGKK